MKRCFCLLSFLLNFVHCVYAQAASYYLPAVAKPLEEATKDGFVTDDRSIIRIFWPNGSFQTNLAYIQAGQGSDGWKRGALVQFDAKLASMSKGTTSTPWIGLVSCDQAVPSIPSGDSVDLFTAAEQKGAVALVLYSLTSNICVIDPSFKIAHQPTSLKLDIYTTPSAAGRSLLLNTFRQLTGASWNDNLVDFDIPKLDAFGQEIVDTFTKSADHSSGRFLSAGLQAANASFTQGTPEGYTLGGSDSVSASMTGTTTSGTPPTAQTATDQTHSNGALGWNAVPLEAMLMVIITGLFGMILAP